MDDDLTVFSGYVYNTQRGYVKPVQIYKEWWETERRWGLWAYVDEDLCDDVADDFDGFIADFKSEYGTHVVREITDIVSPDRILRIEDVV